MNYIEVQTQASIHAINSSYFLAGEIRAQMECWPSKSFHLHQTAGSAGSADTANRQTTAASWRIWYHYWSFTVQWARPFPSNTHEPMCGYTHNAHTELKQSNYISAAKCIIIPSKRSKWLVWTNSYRSLTALGPRYTEGAFLLLLVGILETDKWKVIFMEDVEIPCIKLKKESWIWSYYV